MRRLDDAEQVLQQAHRRHGRRRTVNPLTVPDRYNFLYSPQGRRRHDGHLGTGLTYHTRRQDGCTLSPWSNLQHIVT